MDLLRIVTLNLWNDRAHPLRRMEVAAEGLHALEPHFIGLQEAREGPALAQATELGRRLGMQVAFGAADHDSPGGPIGNAVLSRLPIERVEHLRLPSPANDPRAALKVVARTPAGEVQVTCCHLSWESHMAPARERQVLALDDFTAAPPDVHAFLVGDFNTAPDSRAIRFLTGLDSMEGRGAFFRDAWARRHPQEEGYTFSSANPCAVRWIELNRRIDYIFVRGPVSSRGERTVEMARVVLDQPSADGTWASDHFGVFAVFRLTPQAA